jgi:methylmalonyl-CoA/ethylmalonyl-CoA epimerase
VSRSAVSLSGPISHLCYVVEDLPQAVKWWAATFGAGPFLLLPDIEFDTLEGPADDLVWRHSAAFGQWGQIAVELQQIDEARPSSLARSLGVGSTQLTHVAYVVPEPLETSSQLEQAGMARVLHAVFGPVEIFIHQAPALGHGIEIHRGGEMVDGFFAAVAEIAEGWDGSDPLRRAPEL